MQKYFCTRSGIPLMSILKLFVDTFVSLLKREVVVIPLPPVNRECSGFRFINDFKEGKIGKKK